MPDASVALSALRAMRRGARWRESVALLRTLEARHQVDVEADPELLLTCLAACELASPGLAPTPSTAQAAMQQAEAQTAAQNQQVKAAEAAAADAEARAEAQATAVAAENAAEDAKRDAMTRTSGVPAAAAPASAGQQQQLHAAWRSRLLFLQYGSLAMAA